MLYIIEAVAYRPTYKKLWPTNVRHIENIFGDYRFQP